MPRTTTSRTERDVASVHFDAAVGPVGEAGREGPRARQRPTPDVAARAMIGLLASLQDRLGWLRQPDPTAWSRQLELGRVFLFRRDCAKPLERDQFQPPELLELVGIDRPEHPGVLA